jgi:hypothetical protein
MQFYFKVQHKNLKLGLQKANSGQILSQMKNKDEVQVQVVERKIRLSEAILCDQVELVP